MNNDQSLPLLVCVCAIMCQCFTVKRKRIYNTNTCTALPLITEAPAGFNRVPKKETVSVFLSDIQAIHKVATETTKVSLTQ